MHIQNISLMNVIKKMCPGDSLLIMIQIEMIIIFKILTLIIYILLYTSNKMDIANQ